MMTLWSIPSFDRVFDDVMRSTVNGFGTTAGFTPAVDIRSREDAVLFTMDMPGVKLDDLTVTLEHRQLTVKGARKLDVSEKEQISVGRPYGDFELSYTLPDDMDGEHLSANLADGVLTIVVPKHPQARPRRIQITSGEAAGGAKQLGE